MEGVLRGPSLGRLSPCLSFSLVSLSLCLSLSANSNQKTGTSGSKKVSLFKQVS
jgi:hypothetical protein